MMIKDAGAIRKVELMEIIHIELADEGRKAIVAKIPGEQSFF